uniref:Elongation factor 1-delta n=1 Tax=Ditylenchus dipsaci TaxID=166011 RepID=A0A915DHU6_9BILA
MSAQSLLSEVPSNLATQHVIKSADQLYFKDKQVYTQPQTEVLHSAGAKANGSDNKEKSTSGSESQPLSAFLLFKTSLRKALKQSTKLLTTLSMEILHNASSTDVEALRKDVANLKTENQQMHKEIAEIRQILQKLTVTCGAATTPAAPAAAPATSAKKAEADADEDFDLFGSEGSEDEEESAEQKRVRDERLAAYAEKKSKKPGVIAKSSVILDIKPWEDTTNMVEMEEKVRTIELDGLLWEQPNWFLLRIEGFEDHVQSVDVVAFNKI